MEARTTLKNFPTGCCIFLLVFSATLIFYTDTSSFFPLFPQSLFSEEEANISSSFFILLVTLKDFFPADTLSLPPPPPPPLPPRRSASASLFLSSFFDALNTTLHVSFLFLPCLLTSTFFLPPLSPSFLRVSDASATQASPRPPLSSYTSDSLFAFTLHPPFAFTCSLPSHLLSSPLLSPPLHPPSSVRQVREAAGKAY